MFFDTHKEKYANLGRRPDDLVDVLTDMAIASPAICIKRTYQHYVSENEEIPVYLPSQLARVFINRMNTPEATAVVELTCGRKSDDAHWQNLLTYCRHGKAALYIVTALDMKRRGEDTVIRDELELEIVREKLGHPSVIRIYPNSEKEFETDFARALNYLPKKIEVTWIIWIQIHIDQFMKSMIGEDYDALHDAFEILLKNWRVIQDDPDKSDIDFYIGQDNSSGIYAKSKEEFFSYLSELISEAEKRGEEHFDINIV